MGYMPSIPISLGAVLLLAASACSNSPIGDDVVSLSTSDIVDKVACEAQSAILAYEAAHRFDDERFRLAKANLAISGRIEQFKLRNSTIQSTRSALAATDAEVGKTEQVYSAALRKIEILKIEIADVAEHISTDAETVALAKVADLEKRFLVDATAFRTALFARKQLIKVRAPLQDVIDTLAGERKHIGALCAKRDAAFRNVRIFDTSDVTLHFEYDITEDNSGTAQAKFDWTTNAGSVSLPASLQNDKTRNNLRKNNLSLSFKELRDRDCAGVETAPGNRARRYPISGNTGMTELTAGFLKITESSAIVDQGLYQQILTFTTTLGGTTNPSLTFRTAPGPNITVSFPSATPLSASRTDIHKVTADFGSGVATNVCLP